MSGEILRGPRAPWNAAADAAGVARMLEVIPAWTGLERARDATGLTGRQLLHAGPAFGDPAAICRPLLNSAITAALYEGWAASADDAERQVREGTIRLAPAQDRGCVVPLAYVCRPRCGCSACATSATRRDARGRPSTADRSTSCASGCSTRACSITCGG